MNQIMIWGYAIFNCGETIWTNMAEIVWCGYDASIHAIEDHTTIVVQCCCGGYHNNNIAATIVDVDCNLKPCFFEYLYRCLCYEIGVYIKISSCETPL